MKTFQLQHGAPGDTFRHVGDLGNIQADQQGVAIIDMEDPHLSLTGINNILGRGVVVHAGRDDMGKVRAKYNKFTAVTMVVVDLIMSMVMVGMLVMVVMIVVIVIGVMMVVLIVMIVIVLLCYWWYNLRSEHCQSESLRLNPAFLILKLKCFK